MDTTHINNDERKVYKFIGLDDASKWQRVEDLMNGKFFCSTFTEFNDPGEGMFITDGSIKDINQIGTKKLQKYIFCTSETYQHVLLRGYYACGFCGVAVELTIQKEDQLQRHKVSYNDNMPCITERTNDKEIINKILTRKSTYWKHEKEHRLLVDENSIDKDENGNTYYINTDIKVTKIYFGNPYSSAVNYDMLVQGSAKLNKYYKNLSERKKALEQQKIIFENFKMQ